LINVATLTISPTLKRIAHKELGVVLALVGLLFWFIAVVQADFLHMGALGLVSVLGWAYFFGLALVCVAFGIELLRSPMQSRNMLVITVILLIFMYATASAIEPVAALTDSWTHTGFIQYIIQHGHPLNNYDARFSWPGGFSLGAVLVAFVGKTDAVSFLRYFPPLIELAYLAPLLVIARESGVSRRATWLGIAIYYSTNWIYQDYFSPQALNYLFLLVIIAVVLVCFKPRQRFGHVRGYVRARIVQSRAVVSRARLAGEDSEAVLGARTTLALLAFAGLVALASAMSHQLTPYALILALCACLITRRLGRPELIVLVGLLAVGWLSLGASNFWLGHLSSIFGSVGTLSSTLGSNVTSRVTGNTSHLLVVDLRILLTAGLLFLAGVGFLRRATDSRLLEALAVAPFLLVAAQNYGGEGLLRVILYGLPFTSLLAASAILPLREGAIRPLVPSFKFRRSSRLLLSLTVIALVLGFSFANTVVRGGNDSYESFSIGELDAVNYAYDHAKPGDSIGVVYPDVPIGQRDVGTVGVYTPDGNGATPTVKKVGTLIIRNQPTFVILSQSQEAWGEQVAGYPVGWELTVEATLLQHGFSIVATWSTATVLRFNPT
jgi:hypothetical protein